MSDLVERYGIFKICYYSTYSTIYGLVKYLPPPVGDILRFIVMKAFLMDLNGWVWIKDGVTITFPENVQIDKDSSLNEHVFINGYGSVQIGNCVRIGHNTSIISEDHGFDRKDIPIHLQKKKGEPVIIQDDVWIGCNVTVLKGITIGQGAIIGAGSVVTRDIPPYAVAVGNPAQVIKYR